MAGGLKERKQQGFHNPADEDAFNPARQTYNDNTSLHNSSKDLAGREKSVTRDINKSFEDDVSLAEKESSPNEYYYEKSNKSSEKHRTNTIFNNKKWLIPAGGGAAILIGLFASLLPLKLVSLLENISDAFGSVPEYAINKRMEYVVTRWLATRMIQTAHGDDPNLVFCKGGGVLCSLGSTKYNAWFEKKLGVKFESEGKNVRVVFEGHGHNRLGGKATHFTMHLESTDPGSVMRGVEKELSHKEMRQRIKSLTRKVHGKNFMLRYLSKRVLYQRYGIKRFNIFPEKGVKKYADFKAKVKKKMYDKIASILGPRVGSYISCINTPSPKPCQESLDRATSDLDAKKGELDKEAEKYPEDSEERKKLEAQKKILDGQKDIVNTTGSAGKSDNAIGKIFSKELLKKVAGPVAVAGIIDTIAKIVGAIDSNILEMIGRDRMSITYLNFAFDENIGPLLMADTLKSGDLKNIEQLQLATELFDGAESSPLYQHIQTGVSPLLSVLTGPTTSASGGIRTKCLTDSGEKVITLPPGELVCPERKIVQSYSSFKEYPGWKALSSIADAWNSTIGVIFDLVGDIVGDMLSGLVSFMRNLPGLSYIIDAGQEAISSLFEWGISLIFHVPDIGIDAPGNQNYEAFAGGMTVAMSAGLEAGQSDDGSVSGIGGALLSDSQLAMISDRIERDRAEDFNQQPILAKIFDPYSSRSVAGQLLAVMPVNKSAAISSLLRTPAIFGAILTPQVTAKDRTAILKAFGVPWYGYTDPAVFSADPAIYTEEFCKNSAKERQDSYELREGYLVPTYGKSDPCALERTIGGILAYNANDIESPNYLREIDGGSGGASTSSAAIGAAELEEAQGNWGYPNGQIPDDKLQPIQSTGEGRYKLHPHAAKAFDTMNEQYAKDHGGEVLTISESYRTFATQQDYYNSGITQAPPGTSNHGWGLALDLNVGTSFDTPQYIWLAKNAGNYGFVNPRWARDRTDPRWYKDEPWHWEYARKVN